MKVTADEVVVLYLSQWKKHNKAHFYVPYGEFFKVAPRRLSSLMRSIKLDKSAGYFKKKDYVEGIKEFLEWLKSTDVEIEGEINFERVKEYVETARDYTQAMKYKEKKKGVEVEEKKENPPKEEGENMSEKKEVKVEEKKVESKVEEKPKEPKESQKRSKKLTGKLIEDMKRTASREKAIYMQNLKRAEVAVQKEKKEESVSEKEEVKKKPGFFEMISNNWWILAIAGGLIAVCIAFVFMKRKKKVSTQEIRMEAPQVEVQERQVVNEQPKKEAVDWRELVGGAR